MRKIKNILYGLLLLILLAPILQAEFDIFKIKELGGYVEEGTFNTKLSSNDWLNKKYQNNKESDLKQKIGLRNLFIRIYNQYCFTFFNQVNVSGVIIGKDNYLFEIGYINTHFGLDYEGDSLINVRVQKIESLQDTLEKIGVRLLIGIAPGKASYMPEMIPEEFLINKNKDSRTTNYDSYKLAMDRSRIEYIDYLSWFLKMKDTTSHFLYPKTGIHWSKYAEVLVADSISKYFKNQFNLNMPELNIMSTRKSDIMWDTDDDIEKSMNLLFNIPDLDMTYVEYEIDSIDYNSRPKVTVLGDSYSSGFFNYGFNHRFFRAGEFWYYNQTISRQDEIKELVRDVNLKEKVESNDVIYIQVTEPHLKGLGFGFIDQVYEIYFEPHIYKMKCEVRLAKKQINNNLEWKALVEAKAKEKSISYDSCLYLEAMYVAKQRLNNSEL